jgi:hypothetical protein
MKFAVRSKKKRLTYWEVTRSMQQSTFWEASGYSSGQQIPRILWNPKVYSCFCKSRFIIHGAKSIKSTPFVPIYLGFILILSYLQLVLPSELFPSAPSPQTPVRTSVFPHTITCPTHSILDFT